MAVNLRVADSSDFVPQFSRDLAPQARHKYELSGEKQQPFLGTAKERSRFLYLAAAG